MTNTYCVLLEHCYHCFRNRDTNEMGLKHKHQVAQRQTSNKSWEFWAYSQNIIISCILPASPFISLFRAFIILYGLPLYNFWGNLASFYFVRKIPNRYSLKFKTATPRVLKPWEGGSGTLGCPDLFLKWGLLYLVISGSNAGERRVLRTPCPGESSDCFNFFVPI